MNQDHVYFKLIFMRVYTIFGQILLVIFSLKVGNHYIYEQSPRHLPRASTSLSPNKEIYWLEAI